MKKLPRIVSVEPVIHGVVKIVWTDGYQGIVDLRPTIARGRIFAYLRKSENFQKVKKGEYGHSIAGLMRRGRKSISVPTRCE
jgi:hypothetical protein